MLGSSVGGGPFVDPPCFSRTLFFSHNISFLEHFFSQNIFVNQVGAFTPHFLNKNPPAFQRGRPYVKKRCVGGWDFQTLLVLLLVMLVMLVMLVTDGTEYQRDGIPTGRD